MTKIKLIGGRIVRVSRDVLPMRGETSPAGVAVTDYGNQMLNGPPKTVARAAELDTPRFQYFKIDTGSEGDRLLEILKRGPVKAKADLDRNAWLVDFDRIERP